MNIAIIGCGYVGSAAADYWQQQGHSITATTTTPAKLDILQQRYGKAVLLVGQQQQGWEHLLENNQVILLSVAPSSSTNYEETYLKTARALTSLLENNGSVSQIIYTGSTSVYGSHEGKWVDETSALLGTTAQSRILIETEQTLLQAMNECRQVAIFRLSEIYGPGREIHERLKRFQEKAAAGDGSNYVNLIHLEDIIRALDFAIVHKLKGIYNLCNDLNMTRKEFYERICEANHLRKVSWDPSKATSHGGNRRVSNQKIKSAGFRFLHKEYRYSKSCFFPLSE